MGERTTGVLVGGIIALLGAILGFFVGILILGTVDILAIFNPITMYAWIAMIMSLLVLILSILIVAGKWIKISTILVFIAGIIGLLLIVTGNWLYVLPGILELIGAIIAMATGALS